MKVRKLKTWKSFKERFIAPYLALSRADREMYWFRGQSDAAWSLRTSLDRSVSFATDEQRNEAAATLLLSFRRELIGLGHERIPDGTALELLARHHGLPTSLLDWTHSPYVAAFFAFEGALSAKARWVSVYALDRNRIPELPELALIDDPDLLRHNTRALEQRGAFLRVGSIAQTTEEFLGDALEKCEILAVECHEALVELEAMNITAVALFRDADHAAQTAWAQFR